MVSVHTVSLLQVSSDLDTCRRLVRTNKANLLCESCYALFVINLVLTHVDTLYNVYVQTALWNPAYCCYQLQSNLGSACPHFSRVSSVCYIKT